MGPGDEMVTKLVTLGEPLEEIKKISVWGPYRVPARDPYRA